MTARIIEIRVLLIASVLIGLWSQHLPIFVNYAWQTGAMIGSGFLAGALLLVFISRKKLPFVTSAGYAIGIYGSFVLFASMLRSGLP